MPSKKQPRKKQQSQSDLTRPIPGQKDRRVDREKVEGGQFAPFVPTDQERISVCLARAMGFREEQTALFVRWPRGIDVDTLKKHFPAELEMGKEFIDARMTGSLVAIGSQKDDLKAALGAIKWWQVNKMGWKGENAFTLKRPGGEESEGDDSVSEVTFVIGTPMGKTESKQDQTQPKGA